MDSKTQPIPGICLTVCGVTSTEKGIGGVNK
jgi:hypothetical protein